MAIDRDQLSREPHAHRRARVVREIERGGHAMGECVCGHLHHQRSPGHRILHVPETIHKQFRQFRHKIEEPLSWISHS